MFDPHLVELRAIQPPSMFHELTPTLWLAKLVGAMAGSLISIAYVLPHGRREAFLRLGVGVATGVVFGGTVGAKLFDVLGLLDKISVVEMTLVGAAACSLFAWWGLGMMRRGVEGWIERKLDRGTRPNGRDGQNKHQERR
ncbi:MAG: DUF6107 family protein [Ahrensia sp.]|nr:DUF6107 family protein [Ahrensia sp.]